MDEAVWEEHTVVLEKAPGLGYGIAIGGGRDNPAAHTGDASIVISDVVRQGPAFDKVRINDVVARVNGKPMFNMDHAKAVKELKNSGQRVELTIKRKIMVRSSTPPRHRSRSRDFDSLPRRRSRERDRYSSRNRDRDDGGRRRRSRSRGGYHDDKRRSRRRSRSPRRYSRSPSYHRGRSRSRSRTPSRRRKARSPSPSLSSSGRSVSPPGEGSSPARMERHQPVDDLTRMLSPDPDGAVFEEDMTVFPVMEREPKTVVLKKTRWNNSYGLKFGTKIFIQDIQPGSLADKRSDIAKGDTVLMINGRNVDNKSVSEAIQIIGSNKDNLTMVVRRRDGGTVSLPAKQFNAPEPSKERKDSMSGVDSHHSQSTHSRKSSLSDHSVHMEETHFDSHPQKSASQPEKKQFGGVQVLPPGVKASRSSSSSSQSTPEPAPRSKNLVAREYSVPPPPEDEEGSILPPKAKQITFVKEQSVGIRLAGGNDVGIFVASVQEGSPAAKQGLKTGHHILSVNDVSFQNVIREEAVLTLMGLPTGKQVRIIALPEPDVYKKIVERGTGDSFYVRTHFKYEKNGVHEMSFGPGATFRISDTLYQGMVGYWLAVRIGRNNMEVERGVIPNSSRAEQLKMVQDKKKSQLRDRNSRGISRRLLKSQKSSEAVTSSSSSAMFSAYERVVLREAGFKRPAVIFGPLADIARERLGGDYPDVYEIARNEGTVTGQKTNRKGVIRLNSIKSIIEKDKHAILDITPTAVEKLNHAQLYPIVVFLDAHSKSVVKELRLKLSATEQERKKKPGKLYDRGNKLQRGYNHVFTDTIKLSADSDDWYRKLNATIKDQQSTPVWVSEDKLTSSPDEAGEGVTVSGDDDRLSYVSAPASDYSVTTVGSEFVTTQATDYDETSLTIENHLDKKLPVIHSSDDDDGQKFEDDDFGDSSSSSDEEQPLMENPIPPAVIESESIPEAPPREKKITHQKAVHIPSSSSSSSEEEDSPSPAVSPRSLQNESITREETPRGKQEIPEGRFDPQTFLKSHIKGLKSVDSQDEADSPTREEAFEPSVPAAKSPPAYKQPPPAEKPAFKSEPQQPIYAQVNKRRPPPSRDDSAVVDGRSALDSYRRPNYNSLDSRRQPAREEPFHHVSPPQSKSTSTYNRFAGSTQPKPYQPYNFSSSKPSNQSQPQANGLPQTTNPLLDKYKGNYLNQKKPAQTSSAYSNPKPFSKPELPSNGLNSKEDISASDDDDPQVVATARGVFDSNGGVLSSVETGVSIVIPKGAIPPRVKQEIYFKVCRDNTALPPLDKDKGETLLSPLVMCGPHGLQFEHPVELRLPHCASMTSDGWSFSLQTSEPGEPSQWQNANSSKESNNYDVGSNSVSVLIDHF